MESGTKSEKFTKFKQEIERASILYKNGKYASAVLCLKKAQELYNYSDWLSKLDIELDKNSYFWDSICIFYTCFDTIDYCCDSINTDCGCCCGVCCAFYCVEICCSRCGCDCAPCCGWLCNLPCKCCFGCDGIIGFR